MYAHNEWFIDVKLKSPADLQLSINVAPVTLQCNVSLSQYGSIGLHKWINESN